MSREIFGPQKFKVEEKMIEKIAGKEERGKETKKAPPKTGEVKLSAEERRELREKMDRETAKFLRPVSRPLTLEEVEEKIRRKEKANKIIEIKMEAEDEAGRYASESEDEEKKLVKEEMVRKQEESIRKDSKRKKSHRTEKGESMVKYHKGGKKPPKYRKIPEVRGI